MDKLIQGDTEIKQVVTREVTVKMLFTEEMLASSETFTYTQLFNAISARRKEEVVAIPDDMRVIIERYVGHSADVVLQQVKQQLPNNGQSDEFISAAIAQIRA